MGKKLVKTAKQQFEERLREVGLLEAWERQGSQGRIGKDLVGEGIVIFIHESKADGYSEYHYPSFDELRDDSNFVQNCLNEFSSNDDDFILSMVKWFTYDQAENPFDAVDVYFPADTFKRPSSVNFEDLYEEVEDDPYVTAKGQALRDIKEYGLNKELDETNGEYFCGDVNGKFVIIVIYSECEPCRYEFAKSREGMYRDKDFQSSIMKCFSSDRGADEVMELFEWTKDTEKQEPFDLYDIINAIELHGGPATCVCYEGKPQAIKNEFKDEMNALRTKMVAHIEQLCEQGLTVNVEVLCQNVFLLYTDTSYVRTEDIYDFWIGKDNKDEWKTYRKDAQGEWKADLEEFTVETLKDIIEALQ